MSDLFKEAEEKNKIDGPSPSRVFLEFKYPEIKDLLKHFLTLISAALVFSVTFSEKIINFEKAGLGSKIVVISAWAVLVLALGACGLGIYTLYLAAERAIETVVSGEKEDYYNLVRRSYLFQDGAGILFGLGLCLLIIAAVHK